MNENRQKFCNFAHMNPRLSSFGAWLRRYMKPATLLCLAAVAYIVFSGEYTVFHGIDYDRQIDSLRHELASRRDSMLYYRDLNRRLNYDRELIEKVVREQYGMTRPGEDVYIFKNDK